MKQAGSLASSMKKRYITIPMLILLLAPTILSLLMGAEFVHLPFQKVPTIIVNHDHSETVQSLIQMISDNRTFDVIACTDEEDDLKMCIRDRIWGDYRQPDSFTGGKRIQRLEGRGILGCRF